MNIYANARGSRKTRRQIEAFAPADRLETIWQQQWELDLQRRLSGRDRMARRAIALARQLSPVAFGLLLDTLPSARSSFNRLTTELLAPFLQIGERDRLRQEAGWFRDRGTHVVVRNTEIAQQAALSEVLAASASATQSEGESAAFIGAMLPISLRVMNGNRLSVGQTTPTIGALLPLLLTATARLVRFFHRHSPAGRNLIRLLPTILRLTIASLLAIRRSSCRLTPALLGCVLAMQTSRVLANPQLVSDAIVRNSLIYDSTVATVPSRFRGSLH
jgi:hypothetical protein